MTVAASTGEVGISFDSRYSRPDPPGPRPEPVELLDLDLAKLAADAGLLAAPFDISESRSEVAKRAVGCPNPMTYQQADGTLVDGWRTCVERDTGRGSWSCPTHGPKRQAEVLRYLSAVLAEERVWFLLTTDPKAVRRASRNMARYREANRRRVRLLGEPAYWSCQRADCSTLILTTFPPGPQNRDGYTEVAPLAALALAREALRQPGLQRPAGKGESMTHRPVNSGGAWGDFWTSHGVEERPKSNVKMVYPGRHIGEEVVAEWERAGLAVVSKQDTWEFEGHEYAKGEYRPLAFGTEQQATVNRAVEAVRERLKRERQERETGRQ